MIAATINEVESLEGKFLIAKKNDILITEDHVTASFKSCLFVNAGTILFIFSQKRNKWGDQVIHIMFNGNIYCINITSNNLSHAWRIIEPNDHLHGKTFVFAGRFSGPHSGFHSYYKSLIECFGGNFESNVTTETDYLVVNDKNYESAKTKKAKKLGVSIINEDEFLNLISK